MYKIYKIAILFIASSVGLFSSVVSTPLVNAEWLDKNLHNVKIIDVRNSLDNENYIVGSLSSPYKNWRSIIKDNPGAVPSFDILKENVESLGLAKEDSIVIVFEGKNGNDFGSAARVYWTLKYIGFNNLSILNGGLLAYKKLSNPHLVSKAIIAKRSIFHIEEKKEIITSTDQVAKVAKNHDDKILLLDSRSDDQYFGRSKSSKAKRFGAIKNSKQLWHVLWFDNNSGSLQDREELEKIADKYHVPKNKDSVIYSYCNTGHKASTSWFVLSEILGYKKTMLFPDSIAKYSQGDNIYLINEPSRLRLLWREVKNWFL